MKRETSGGLCHRCGRGVTVWEDAMLWDAVVASLKEGRGHVRLYPGDPRHLFPTRSCAGSPSRYRYLTQRAVATPLPYLAEHARLYPAAGAVILHARLTHRPGFEGAYERLDVAVAAALSPPRAGCLLRRAQPGDVAFLEGARHGPPPCWRCSGRGRVLYDYGGYRAPCPVCNGSDR